MKTVASFPAYDVVDFGVDVIGLPAEVVADRSFRFCVEVQGPRGVTYQEVVPGCVAYYAEKNGCNPEIMVNGAKARGENLFWLINVGASLTAHKRAKYNLILLKAGQMVKMGETLLEVRHKRAEFFELVELGQK